MVNLYPIMLSVSLSLQVGQYIQPLSLIGPDRKESPAMNLALCHYPTTCGTMQDFPGPPAPSMVPGGAGISNGGSPGPAFRALS